MFPLAVAALCGACGARYRPEVIGTARTTAGGGGPAAAVAIDHPTDRHQIQVWFALPRATVVAYQVSCPGETFEGTVGESWEQYRERRLRELRAERQRQVNAVGSLVGAAVGHAGAGARVETPAAEGEVEAEVDGEAAGRAVADSAIADVQLPPGDVGAQRHQRSFTVHPADAGQCAVTLASAPDGEPIDGVTADITVTRFVDLARERAAARVEAERGAIEVRGKITAELVASGADPDKRRREREEQARIRAELEAKRLQAQREEQLRVEAELRVERERKARERRELELRLEAERRERREAELRIQAERRAEQERRWRVQRERELRIQAEIRHRDELALEVRGRIVGYLIASGCDPHKRQREREAEARRREQERLRVEAELRVKREAELRRREQERLAYEAELRAKREHQLRVDNAHRAAFEVRGRIVGWLIAGGADPDYRRKRDEADLRAFQERSQREREERLAIEAAIRTQTEGALRVRAGIKLALIEGGAIDRPPRPAPPMETRPEPPAPGAVWVAGYYIWSGISWEWQSGYWGDPPASGAVWVAPVEIVINGAAVLRPGGWHDKKTGKRVKTRDHRRR